MLARRLFNHDQLDRLADAVKASLTEAGIKVCSRTILERLADQGANVDFERQVARCAPEMIESIIETQDRDRGRKPAAASADADGARESRGPARTPAGAAYHAGFGFHITPHIYDWPTRRRRFATKSDLMDMIRLADALPDVAHASCPVVCSDIDPRVEAIEAFAMLVCHTNKPPSVTSILPEHNEYFAEIGEIALGPSGGPPRFIGTGGFVISPTTVGDRLAAMMLEGEKYRVPSAGCGTMAISGLSAPATIAGAIVAAAADLLGGIIALRAANPHAKRFSAGTATGILDMRTTKACFGTPECAIQDVGVYELFEERLGGHCGVSGRGYIDARFPGMQAVYEKLLKSSIIDTALGERLRVNNLGLLDGGSMFSPTQYMVEKEMDEGLHRAMWEVEVSAETIALDDILEVGPGEGRNFLGTQHTLEHFREAWYPNLFDHDAGRPEDRAAEEAILNHADAHWRDLVANHTLPDVDAARVKAVNEVVERARRQLLS